MSLVLSPSIVTNGLVLYYDMNNTKKSWEGRPITNQFAIPTPDSNFDVYFEVNGTGVFKRVLTGRYGGYDITTNDVVYRYDLGATGCHYHGNDVTITAGQVATWSFDYFVDPSVIGYPSTNFLANFEGVLSGSIADPTPTEIGVWKKLTFSGTAGSTGTCRMLLYPGACGDRLASGGFVLFKNPQVEFDAPGNTPSPFVAGTRSNTQALLDLTGNSILTPSLTYASDNTFSFSSASSNAITVPLSTGFNKLAGSINFWVHPTGYNGGNGYFVNRDDATANAVDWLWIGPYSDTFYFRIGDGTACCANDLSIGSWSTVAPINTWINLCFTWLSAGTSVIYKNGEYLTSRAISAIPATNPTATGRIGLGHANADSFFNGKIAATQIYNRQLSAVEVYHNFQTHRGRYGL